MLTNETTIKVNETVSFMCDELIKCVNSANKNGGQVSVVHDLPDLVNSIANLVNASKD